MTKLGEVLKGILGLSEDVYASVWSEDVPMLALDLETTMDHKTIHMCGWSLGHKKGTVDRDDLTALLLEYTNFSGVFVTTHNGIKFDYRVLEEVWDIRLADYGLVAVDSIVLGRLLDPQRPSHALKSYAKDMDVGLKGEFTDFDGPGWYPPMLEGITESRDQWLTRMAIYCEQDTVLCFELTKRLLGLLKERGFSLDSIWLEHLVASAIQDQVEYGFKLDVRKAQELAANWGDELGRINDHLVATFPPRLEQLKTKVKVHPFNPGSRQQCVAHLTRLGWKPAKYTEPTPTHPNGSAILDDDALELIAKTIPEATEIARYFQLTKARAMVLSWLTAADAEGRVHGSVNSNGAVSGRMTHSAPNLGQIPKRDEEIGPLCRSCWIVDVGNRLVGVDAKGLELRTFAHYLQDAHYMEVLLNGDPHAYNQAAAGLDTRDQAKTFIYAYLYGAGDQKIGSIVLPKGTPEQQRRLGKKLKAKFRDSLPGVAKLAEKIQRIYKAKGSLPGLDGRQLAVRSEHSALNLLLQSAGAIAMKVALVLLFFKYLPKTARIVVNVHDEWQTEAPAEDAEEVAKAGLRAIQEAGEVLEMRCPLEGDAKTGFNWHDTH